MMQPVKAKKHLGQHFLTDSFRAQKIVEDFLQVLPPHTAVLEVGPGTGVLTQHLLNRAPYTGLDIDTESMAYLKQHFAAHASAFVLQDVLTYTFNHADQYGVIGNFPYNISSPIMFKVLEYRNTIPVVVGMFQKEVAQRIAEKPGSKTYGILSVLLQAYYNIEYLYTVHENAFSPPPKVKSAVIRLVRKPQPEVQCAFEPFKTLVKTCFNQRRKTIRNSIKALHWTGDTTSALFSKRPEQLSVKDFETLCLLLFPQ
jgi:16S rRNA (adenine1518-N6/adenine1519-N6)-dimethyltransferase